MKSFKEIAEARFVATADYKISASGRKVHKMKKIADDPRDDDVEDAEDDKLKESIELEEAISVKKQDYSWGKMVTVHHGSDTSYPLHPEHQHAIKKLKDGEHTSFTDETNRKVTAHREGDNVHLSSRDSNKKTTVAHSHFTESVNKSDVPAYLRKKTGDQLTTQDLEKERTKNRSHPETLKKINGTEVKESAPVAPVPDKKYIKGTPEWKANKEKNKPRTGHPTNESVEQLDESKWEKTGAHGLAKDFGDEGHVSTTKKTITVRARVHNSSHSDGAPVLKNFDRKDRHKIKTVTIPKGSKVVHNKASGYNYTHHPEHGHVEFDHDDVEKKEGVEFDFDTLYEAVDKQEQRFLMLARLGLVDKSEVSKLRIAIDQLKADKQLTVQQRTMLLGVMEDLISLVTGDDMVFNRIKQDVQKEDYELVEEEESIVEANDKDWDEKNPPFDPDPPKKNPTATAGKHGSGYSTARHLARLALQKQQKKQGK